MSNHHKSPCYLEDPHLSVGTKEFLKVLIHDWGMLNGVAELSPVKDLVTFSAASHKKHIG